MSEFERQDTFRGATPSRQYGADGQAPLGELRRSVSEVTRILFLRRWFFFVPLCVVMTGAFVMSLYVPRRYVVSTTFERRDDPVLVNLPRNEGSGAFITFQRTLAQDLMNVESLMEVVRSLNLVAPTGDSVSDDASLRRAASRIATGLEVRFAQQSEHLDVIEVMYANNDPQPMAAVLDEVRDHYLRTTQQRITTLLHETKEWFESERRKRLEIVEALEDDLIQFRTEHQGLDPLNPDAIAMKLVELRDRAGALDRKKKEYDTQIAGRRAFLQGGAPPTPRALPANIADVFGLNSPQPSAEARRISAARQRVEDDIKELQTTRGMTDMHPEIIAMNHKRDGLSEALTRQVNLDSGELSVNGISDASMGIRSGDLHVDPATAAVTQAEMEIMIYEKLAADNAAELIEFRAQIGECEGIQRDALVQRKEFSSRQSEVGRAHQELSLYQGYADQVGRVLSAENSQRGILFGKIKPATGSKIPASPRVSTVIILAVTVGLAISVVIVLACEIFDRKVRTRRQVTHGLGLPILESIGEILSSTARRRRTLTQYVLAPSFASAMILIVLGTGALACLSLSDRQLYERVVATPRSLVSKAASIGSGAPPVAATAVETPIRGN